MARMVGEEEAEEGHIFVARPVDLNRLGLPGERAPQRIAGVAAANGCVLTGLQNGEVIRWYPLEEEHDRVDFGRDRCVEVGRVLLEPKGFHAIVTNSQGDSWYLNFQNSQAKALPKLKGHMIEAISWDPESTAASTKDLIVGTFGGQLLHVVIESKERLVKPVFTIDLDGAGKVPVCGVHRERVLSSADAAERTVVFAAAGCGIYAFVGQSLDTLFQRYQGDASATGRALVYEVPRDSPHGDLQVAPQCVGSHASTKVLFWSTGVGVLVAGIRSPFESESQVLESPPGLIPYPRAARSQARMTAGSLIASLLPPPPPPPPLAFALTQYHILLVFEDRWCAVSRITHEVVQQQEWASSTSGGLRGVVRDVHGEQLWLRSEKSLFELTCEREDRKVWYLLLRMEQFHEALAACKPSARPQRARVLAAHADWLFRRGKFVESAQKFAEAADVGAPTVPFEHVCLRFLRAGRTAALLEYLQCRLRQCPAADKVTRALLGIWAVEFSLAHLNSLKVEATDVKGRAALEVEREKFLKLLQLCQDLDVHATIYHLLQSHGWLQELAFFAEARRDFITVALHHVSRHDCQGAIRKLSEFTTSNSSEQELVCRFAPVLFGAEPRSMVTLLLKNPLSGLDPLAVLPAVYAPEGSDGKRAEAVRYLEHVLQRHPEFLARGDGSGPLRQESGDIGKDFALGKDAARRSSVGSADLGLGSAADETGRGSLSASLGPASWASGTAVLNALTVLYACECGTSSSSTTAAAGAESAPASGDLASGDSPESTLLRFLADQEGNPSLDPCFALRVCTERGLSRVAVNLYGIMGMHEEAVDAALRQGDVALAKHNACKPGDRRLRQKLWLRIVENQAESGDVQRITSLIRESQELTVRDVLPYMSDSITIDAFQEEIRECLDTYEGQILQLRREMDDHRQALENFKSDLKRAEERCIVVPEGQPCEICGAPAVRERFYVFACGHCFHEACLRALIEPVLSAEKRERLFELEGKRVEHQAAAAGSGAPPAMTLADLEEELDGILAGDCPLCGHLMIQTIRRPFIDPGEELEAASWDITD